MWQSSSPSTSWKASPSLTSPCLSKFSKLEVPSREWQIYGQPRQSILPWQRPQTIPSRDSKTLSPSASLLSSSALARTSRSILCWARQTRDISQMALSTSASIRAIILRSRTTCSRDQIDRTAFTDTTSSSVRWARTVWPADCAGLALHNSQTAQAFVSTLQTSN